MQTFGKILESEYQALETIPSHVTHVVFSQLKRKYRGPGTRPDYLNAQELARANISRKGYSLSIKKLLQAGLLETCESKPIKGFQCRLFGFPHERGLIQPGNKETVTENRVIGKHDAALITPLAGQVGNGYPIQGNKEAEQHIDYLPLRLDKENRKENTEEILERMFSTLNSKEDDSITLETGSKTDLESLFVDLADDEDDSITINNRSTNNLDPVAAIRDPNSDQSTQSLGSSSSNQHPVNALNPHIDPDLVACRNAALKVDGINTEMFDDFVRTLMSKKRRCRSHTEYDAWLNDPHAVQMAFDCDRLWQEKGVEPSDLSLCEHFPDRYPVRTNASPGERNR